MSQLRWKMIEDPKLTLGKAHYDDAFERLGRQRWYEQIDRNCYRYPALLLASFVWKSW